MEESFFLLLQASLNTSDSKIEFSKEEWKDCFIQAKKHCLLGVLFPTVKQYMWDESGNRIEPLYHEWLSYSVKIDLMNSLLNKRAEMLTQTIQSWGYRACILKGQGVAQLYPEPSLRQGGDIDIWVDGKQDDIINALKKHNIVIHNIDYVHSSESFFSDVKVEVHFRPSWLYNPFSNNKLQRYFRAHAEEQFVHVDDAIGLTYPTISFNLVYSLLHINRHIFEEGIGLRQLLDYYYILTHSTLEERREALQVIKSVGLMKFAGAIMFIMREAFCVDQDYLLCAPNIIEGNFLLEEILHGGNFGKYDGRNKWLRPDKRFLRGWYNTQRNIRYLMHYPNEVLWIPFWKLWHWCWRKKKGYL